MNDYERYIYVTTRELYNALKLNFKYKDNIKRR